MKLQQEQVLQTKPIVLLDMDDVLADFLEPWIDMYNKDYSDTLEIKTINDWNTSLFVKDECGLKIFDYFKKPGLYRNLPVKPYAIEMVTNLTDLGYEIFIVTDSPMGCTYGEDGWKGSNPADDKRAWLQEHFPMIPTSNFIITGKKWMVTGDILVDDKPTTHEEFLKRGRKSILVDMPYNNHLKTDYRVTNLKEAEEMILKLVPHNQYKGAF